ncbi:16S rRNA (cytidine(1402)-2'-O)-methyltransferase [Corynebacterium heidelbergense]|uniref:Ribosomal RNA small subunit methyltransferase I n=1 Tax=Corynebacterium heidelbergense TaxID=2055947 RepID=A0A364V513_9CORY|nr:16S rRNA (cytidine(1402)-2'-O)-methyltransferase [Corynebacterium heidelbergense]RAV31735.1 16S rRNA (cytidine(1402)-2'-O)-methyltransferase [Corynebacterium heidelbergense]
MTETPDISSAASHLAVRAEEHSPLPHGGIILAGTPLGNPLDASFRLLAALASADVIAAEDTRRVRALAEYLGVGIRGTEVISNFDHNEQQRADLLVQRAAAGQRVLVVTDAGMPSVSDPGFAVVSLARERGVPVTCLPGPSAVPTALALSGVGMGHFSFEGFAPRKDGARRTWLATLQRATHAACFFESPHRLAATLATAAEVLGEEREAAVCRELTKTFEEVRRGTLGELARWAAEGVKGEITVILAPVPEGAATPAVEDVVGEVEDLVADGQRLKAAAGVVAQRYGVSKRDLYEAAVARKDRDDSPGSVTK